MSVQIIECFNGGQHDATSYMRMVHASRDKGNSRDLQKMYGKGDGKMKNGKCETVGYVSLIDGSHVMFTTPRTNLSKAAKTIRDIRARERRTLERLNTADWCELDDHLYPELATHS